MEGSMDGGTQKVLYPGEINQSALLSPRLSTQFNQGSTFDPLSTAMIEPGMLIGSPAYQFSTEFGADGPYAQKNGSQENAVVANVGTQMCVVAD